MGAAFLTTPAPRTSPARHSHSTSGAPPVRGLLIKGAEDRPLPSALRCAAGEIVLPEGRRGVKESQAQGRPLSLTRALHVLPEVAGEHKKSPSLGLTPQLGRVQEESRVLGMGSATTCRLSASNAATAPFPERVPVLLLVAFASQVCSGPCPVLAGGLMAGGTTDKVLGVPSLPTGTGNTHTESHTHEPHLHTFTS